MSRLSTRLSQYPIEMRLIIARGLYGAIVGFVLTLLALSGHLEAMTNALFGNLAPFMTWIYLFLLYIPTVYIARRLGAEKRFDLYFRGLSVYFALAVLTHIIIAST